MSTKSRRSLYGISTQMSAGRAKHARKKADHLTCAAWNYRMLGYKGPAQPSLALPLQAQLSGRVAADEDIGD
jgi:hypothetical protein